MTFTFLDSKVLDKKIKLFDATENITYYDEDEDDLYAVFLEIRKKLHKEKELFVFEITEENKEIGLCVVSTEGFVNLLCIKNEFFNYDIFEFIFKHVSKVFLAKGVHEIKIKVQQKGLYELNKFGFQNVKVIQPELQNTYLNYSYLLRYDLNIDKN